MAGGALPGHELRRRVSQLTGYTRPVSDGSLYPAISRLTEAGLLERRADPGAGPARYVLSLTGAGRTELLKRLRKPADHEITDFTRFFTILASNSAICRTPDGGCSTFRGASSPQARNGRTAARCTRCTPSSVARLPRPGLCPSRRSSYACSVRTSNASAWRRTADCSGTRPATTWTQLHIAQRGRGHGSTS
ncbi:helix-turn-helix transcriptional regulator [Streptomyces sp. NPDC007991]|uniref:PadR family transcriptional regulator n=1 Tax=Streptomyces sp. NPDC007991 TaxID=3364803 RepID=UPI0036E841D6